MMRQVYPFHKDAFICKNFQNKCIFVSQGQFKELSNLYIQPETRFQSRTCKPSAVIRAFFEQIINANK